MDGGSMRAIPAKILSSLILLFSQVRLVVFIRMNTTPIIAVLALGVRQLFGTTAVIVGTYTMIAMSWFPHIVTK
jgi:hypothetical protein